MTTAENGLQLLQGGLKPVQERGALYEAADELRIRAPLLGERVFVHLWWQKAQRDCGWQKALFIRRRRCSKLR